MLNTVDSPKFYLNKRTFDQIMSKYPRHPVYCMRVGHIVSGIVKADILVSHTLQCNK